MAEKDATARLRRAVKENNLFLVKRLIQRTDMRNPDPAPLRYSSLAWAAVLGNEETFEYLLTAGHDDEELSKDSENNTILMLLADHKPSVPMHYAAQAISQDSAGAALRMARMYFDRYSWILDWSNIEGKTALHVAALKGNEELVRMLCDLGADFDLSDNKGNTSLHYASSWGHITIVQLLIERGCQYAARNNEGFTASDYAYSFSTRDTLQDTARMVFENNKKMRRNIFAQAAARGNEWGGSALPSLPPPVPAKDRDLPIRLRSGSGTSRTTATSDSGDIDSHGLVPVAASSSSSQPSTGSSSFFHIKHPTSSGKVSNTHSPSPNPTSTLSPIVNRLRERDADAREKYLSRNRSGSSSTDNKSQNESVYSSAGPSANGDDISALNQHISGSVTPRRLRPSMSAAQLRTTPQPINGQSNGVFESRSRSGTNPSAPRPSVSPLPLLTRSSSTSNSLRSIISPEHTPSSEPETYMGPPVQYARFPEPPTAANEVSTPPSGRRKPFHILSKPSQSSDAPPSNHRRGASATLVRGA